jgi:hypothetical protein
MIQQLLAKYKSQQAGQLNGEIKRLNGLVVSQLQSEYDEKILGKVKKVKKEKKSFYSKDE